MSHVQTLTVNNELSDFLRNNFSVPDYNLIPQKESKEKHQKLEYPAVDEILVLIEKAATILGKMEQGSEDMREDLKKLSVRLFEFVNQIELCIGLYNSLPDSVPWKKRACAKLEHVANRAEDLAETCELAIDEEFNEMIRDQLQSYFDARSED